MNPPLLIHKALPSGLLLLVIGCVISATASPPDFFYTFEEDGEKPTAIDTSGNNLDHPLTGLSHRTTAEAKFGEGSLLIQKSPTSAMAGWYTQMQGSQESLRGEIHKMTVSTWVRPVDHSGAILFLRRSSDFGGRFSFLYASGCLQLTVKNGEEKELTVASSKITLHPEEWVHVAFSFDEGEVRFYMNGEELGAPQQLPEASSIHAVDPGDKSANLAGYLASPVGMHVDDFAFFGNSALDEAAIQMLFSEGLEAYARARSEGE